MPDLCVDAALAQIFTMNGQRCTAGSRSAGAGAAVRADRRSGRRAGAATSGSAIRSTPGPSSDRSSGPSTTSACSTTSRRRAQQGARVLAGGERPDASAGRQLPRGDGDRRRRRAHAGLPGGDLRARARGHAVPRRGATAIRLANATPVRAGGLRLDERPAARASCRARDRHRHVLGQLAERARPAHAVRRRQGQRHRPRGRRLRVRLLLRDRDRAHRARLAPRSRGWAWATRTTRRADHDAPPPSWSPRPPAAPPYDIVRAAYAELQVTDLPASEHFYVDLLGMIVAERTRRRAVPARLGGAAAPLAHPASRAGRGGGAARLPGPRARTTSTSSPPTSSRRA